MKKMMAKLKAYLSASKANVAIFSVSAALVLTASVGAASAAISYLVETYAGRVQMFDIGVTLVENGQDVSWRNYDVGSMLWQEQTGVLLKNMLEEGEELRLDTRYQEVLTVRNSGTINQFVRVSLFKYWVDDKTDEKLPGLAPEAIELSLINIGSEWIMDESSKTPERTVIYYNRVLNSGEETVPFTDFVCISGSVAREVSLKQMPDGSTKRVYDYNGRRFVIECNVDVVQENNAEVASLKWGEGVAIDGTALRLR